MARVKRENPGLKALQSATSLLVVGLPVPRIMEVVEKLEPYMVLMGSSGRTGLNRLLLGSKAAQATHVCPVPITIVRAPHNTESGA
jgi:nucleotide-binding universal stress UspA family protein